jgi:MbtH protein
MGLAGSHRRNGMPNPFEEEDADYLVLVNIENQYSLWPQFCEIPQGWSSVGPRGKRKDCMEWIEQNWTDMRPKSLVDQMNKLVRKE